jgi:hypothetical protein
VLPTSGVFLLVKVVGGASGWVEGFFSPWLRGYR